MSTFEKVPLVLTLIALGLLLIRIGVSLHRAHQAKATERLEEEKRLVRSYPN